MKSLEKLKTVLNDVEINEEQKAALDEFLSELSERIEAKVKGEYESEISDLETALEEAQNNSTDVDLEKYVLKEDAEKAFDLAMNDAEGAFNLAMGDAEAAFEMAMEDAEAAFDLVQEDIITESSEIMAKSIEDLYESLLDKAKEEILESSEFEALKKIKNILAPQIISESDSISLAKKVRELETQLAEIEGEKEVLERDRIVESLVQELPKREAKIVKSYIEEAKNIDEIYERFNLALNLLEAKNSDDDFEVDNDPIDEPEDIVEDIEEIDDLEEIDEPEETIVSEEVILENRNEKEKNKKFTNLDEAIISSIWK